MSGDPIFADLALGWRKLRREARDAEHAIAEHLHHGQPQGEHPYATTETTTETSNQEEDMSQLGDDLRAAASRVDKFDDDVLNDVEKIQANPNTAKAFAKLRTLTGIDADPIFDAAVGLLEAVPQHTGATAAVAAAPATA